MWFTLIPVHFLFASLHDLYDVPYVTFFGGRLITLGQNFLFLFKLGWGLPIIQFQQSSRLFDIFSVSEISLHMKGFGTVSIITAPWPQNIVGARYTLIPSNITLWQPLTSWSPSWTGFRPSSMRMAENEGHIFLLALFLAFLHGFYTCQPVLLPTLSSFSHVIFAG